MTKTYYYERCNVSNGPFKLDAISDQSALEQLDEMFDLENIEIVYTEEEKGQMHTVFKHDFGSGLNWGELR